jgi:hypothetical protein
MRAVVIAVVAACTPDIASGTYFCGVEQACPPDQACNGTDNTCVTKGTQMPFSCTSSNPVVPTFQGCVTAPLVVPDCLPAGQASSSYPFTTPTGCPTLAVELDVTYPLAFEQVDVQLWQGQNMVASSASCNVPTAAGGSESRCLRASGIANGAVYTAVVSAAGRDCGGACNFNRFELSVQLPPNH